MSQVTTITSRRERDALSKTTLWGIPLHDSIWRLCETRPVLIGATSWRSLWRCTRKLTKAHWNTAASATSVPWGNTIADSVSRDPNRSTSAWPNPLLRRLELLYQIHLRPSRSEPCGTWTSGSVSLPCLIKLGQAEVERSEWQLLTVSTGSHLKNCPCMLCKARVCPHLWWILGWGTHWLNCLWFAMTNNISLYRLQVWQTVLHT